VSYDLKSLRITNYFIAYQASTIGLPKKRNGPAQFNTNFACENIFSKEARSDTSAISEEGGELLDFGSVTDVNSDIKAVSFSAERPAIAHFSPAG